MTNSDNRRRFGIPNHLKSSNRGFVDSHPQCGNQVPKLGARFRQIAIPIQISQRVWTQYENFSSRRGLPAAECVDLQPRRGHLSDIFRTAEGLRFRIYHSRSELIFAYCVQALCYSQFVQHSLTYAEYTRAAQLDLRRLLSSDVLLFLILLPVCVQRHPEQKALVSLDVQRLVVGSVLGEGRLVRLETCEVDQVPITSPVFQTHIVEDTWWQTYCRACRGHARAAGESTARE